MKNMNMNEYKNTYIYIKIYMNIKKYLYYSFFYNNIII